MLIYSYDTSVEMFSRSMATTLYISSGFRSFDCCCLFTHKVCTLMMMEPADSRSSNNVQHTTNDEDQQEVAKLKSRLKNAPKSKATIGELLDPPVPSVDIDEGTNKYVLIKAEYDGDEQYIVTSRCGAKYHRNAAEPMIAKLESAGYTDIEVTGGGRISLNTLKKELSIYGFSYGFGLANHSISREVVLQDPRYRHFKVTISDEGY
jgi:phosphohistidine phosphatase